MAILPYRASMQRLMIKLLRIPERKDRLMSVRFKFQNAKTDQASNSRIPESKCSSSFRILGWKERLRFEFPESKDWSSFEFPECKDRAEIRIQGSSQDWHSGWRQGKKIGPRYNKMIQIVLAVFDCTRIDGVWSFSGGMNLLLLQWRRWRKLKDYWIKKAQRLLPQESSKISGIFHWWRQYDTSNCKTAWIFFFFFCNEVEKAQRLLNQASWKISGFSLHRQQYDKSNCKSA